MRDDLRGALRRIVRNPRLSLMAIGTLALGIGAAAAVATMAHTVLIANPPFRDADSVVTLRSFRNDYGGVSGADMLEYKPLFEAIALAGYAEFSWTGQSLPGFDGAEVLRGFSVTADYFRVLDHPLAAGRGFTAGEEGAVVISHGLWQRRFGGRPDIVGQSLVLNGKPHTIVGVAGSGFLSFQPYEVVAWVPFTPTVKNRGSRNFDCYARLARGVSMGEAQQRLSAVAKRLESMYPDTNKGLTVQVAPYMFEVRQKAKPALLVLVGAVACLLLIAAANVASLLLARATAQAREMAIRSALGASRWRLYRLVLTESLLMALAASTLGALIGVWLLSGARSLVPSSMQYDWVFASDARVFIIGVLVAAVAGTIAGAAPAFESFRLAVGGLRPSLRGGRLLRIVVTAEIAVTVVLCIGAGLLGRSFLQLVHRPLGYETDRLLGMRVRLAGERYDGVAAKAAYWDQLMERTRAIPGVARAATVSDLPMGWQYTGSPFGLQGYSGTDEPYSHQLVASPGYFATVGIPILQGRGFTESDEDVVIVNDVLAQKYFGGNAIGKMVQPYTGTWSRVVGVVRQVRHAGPHDDPEPQIYMPYRRTMQRTMFLVVRTHVPPESIVGAVKQVLAELDPLVPAFEIRTVEKSLERELAMPRLPMVLTIGFAGLAAVLATLGLFGVAGYWVAQRTKEIGIRTALGAKAREVRALVLWQGAKMGLAGVTIGVAVSLASMRVLRSLLYGMSERDWTVYAGTVALVLVATALACWAPAERAARIDPARALREE